MDIFAFFVDILWGKWGKVQQFFFYQLQQILLISAVITDIADNQICLDINFINTPK